MTPETLELVKSLSGPGSTLACCILAALFFRKEAAKWADRYDFAKQEYAEAHAKLNQEYTARLEKRDADNTLVIDRCERTMDRVLSHLEIRAGSNPNIRVPFPQDGPR